MEFLTIFNQIVFLAVLAIAGIVGVRFKLLNEFSKETIEKLVFYITLPLLIITKISSLEVTTAILQNSGLVIGFTYLILFFQIVAGKISANILKLPRAQATIHKLHTFLGNIVFLGFPLLDALFPGGEAILYAALYQLAMNTIFWTYGILKLDPKPNRNRFGNLKKLINPNTIALIIALLMVFSGIRLPKILYEPLAGLGSTTLYLAMIYIGILIAHTKIRHMFGKPDVLMLSFNKLFLIPVFLILGIRLLLHLFGWVMNNIAFSVIVLEASMPCMTILVLLAKRYGADDTKAMENFVVSTILSIVSLPVIIFLIQTLKL
jgi:predicted permease